MLPSEVGRSWLCPLEQVGVVAALAELHDDVQQPRSVCTPIHGFYVLLKESSIVLLLHLAHPNLQDGLLLWRQRLLDVALQTPQQEGPQDLHDPRKRITKPNSQDTCFTTPLLSVCLHSY